MIDSAIKYISAVEIIIHRFFLKYVWKYNKHSYIAMFHDVVSDDVVDNPYSCFVGTFESYIANESNDKLIVDGVASLFHCRHGIMITFDDGFKSIITTVLPIMKKYNAPFTVFITTDFVGKDGYLSWDDLMTLRDEPLCTIGSHSMSHGMFRKMTKTQVVDELAKSKELLEKKLNIQVNSFAFPYGSRWAVDFASRKMAKKYYEYVYLTLPNPLFAMYYYRSTFPRLNMPYFLKSRRTSD